MSHHVFESLRLALEFLQVLCSWPVVTFCLVAYFLWTFHDAIAGLFTRDFKLKWGESEATVFRAQPVDADASLKSSPATETQVVATGTLQGAEADCRRELASERLRAHYWEYRFIGLFFVPATQMVLDWLAARESTTLETFEAIWMPHVSSLEQRKMILMVLENHHLISVRGPLIEVTPKGKEYIAFRGPLPIPRVNPEVTPSAET